MAEMTLDDVLKGVEPTADETEAEAEVVETEAETETSTAEVEHKEEAKAEEPEPWTKAAYLDEKRKRQELENRLKEFESRKVEMPDVLDDQKAFVDAIRGDMQTTLAAHKIELSQELMRTVHEDYDQMEAKFLQMANDNPSLAQALRESTNPAKFAYETAKKAERFEALQNVDAYEAKIRAEIEAKIRAELTGQVSQKAQKDAAKESALKPSLAIVGESSNETEVDDDLDQILGRDANHRKKR